MIRKEKGVTMIIKKAYITGLLVVLSTGFGVVAAVDYTQQIRDLEENIAQQADAITVLTQKVNELQQKKGLKGEVVQLEGITLPPAQKAATPAEQVNQLRAQAIAQSKALNQLAENVVLFQHQLGIQPEGTEGIGTGAAGQQPSANPNP